MKRARVAQTDLFGASSDGAGGTRNGVDVGAPATDLVGAAPAAPELVALAERMPAAVRLGTSSWAFPGWSGLVYSRTESAPRLSRHGLRAYAQHPLLRAVGLDRTFYAPIAASDFAAYAEQVPTDFQFLVKACAALTTPGGLRRGRGTSRVSSSTPDHFLDPAFAVDQVIGPAVQGLGDRLGVLLFQFPPLPYSGARLRAFPDALERFLEGLPRGVPYAVEVRNRALLSEQLAPTYADALRAGGATHCYSVHPTMPGVLAQRAMLGASVDSAGPVAVRWMLRPDQEYESAREAWAPFDELAAPDLVVRGDVATLVQGLVEANVKTIVIANNKAEGSAPRTLTELARLVATSGEPDGTG